MAIQQLELEAWARRVQCETGRAIQVNCLLESSNFYPAQAQPETIAGQVAKCRARHRTPRTPTTRIICPDLNLEERL